MKKLLGLLLFISFALSANAQLLWKISGKGLEKPSYIFGTYHLSPLSIKDSIAAMPQAMNETSQVYGEIIMADMMQPAAINQQLTVLIFMKHTPGFNPQASLDAYFQQQAQQQGKKVGGLETIQSQIDILFNSQPLRRQAALLHCMASDIDKTVDQSKRLIEAYEKQDLDAMLQLMEERDGNSCDPLPGEMEALLDNRNMAWVEKMPAIMTEVPTLFVVGAGHLPGDHGVLNLLKQQGFTIEAMK